MVRDCTEGPWPHSPVNERLNLLKPWHVLTFGRPYRSASLAHKGSPVRIARLTGPREKAPEKGFSLRPLTVPTRVALRYGNGRSLVLGALTSRLPALAGPRAKRPRRSSTSQRGAGKKATGGRSLPDLISTSAPALALTFAKGSQQCCDWAARRLVRLLPEAGPHLSGLPSADGSRSRSPTWHYQLL
jgi:hypothetical protein